MSHTINTSWDFISVDLNDGQGTKSLIGVRWADGHEVLFKDMPAQQTKAYLKRAGVKDPKSYLDNKVNN
jgi:hypothetical protein